MSSTLEVDTPKFYPRTSLNGPLKVWFSSRLKEEDLFPKYHLDKSCRGLEKVSEEKIGSDVYTDAFELGEDVSGRPCRECSLERVLYTVLRKRAKCNKASPLVFTTFSSQPCPTDPGAILRKYRWRESSSSGQERLLRISEKLSLKSTFASPGPVAWGFLPSRGVDILKRNLRTEVLKDVKSALDPFVIECAWSLLDDNPPQLRSYDNLIVRPNGMVEEAPDPWEVAKLLVV